LRNNVATVGTVNDADAVSPRVPVTVTVYGPVAPLATTKDPDIKPVGAILHSGLAMSPIGVEEIAHPVSSVLKPEPVTRTFVPTSPTVGNKSIFAVTVKAAVPTSRRYPGDSQDIWARSSTSEHSKRASHGSAHDHAGIKA